MRPNRCICTLVLALVATGCGGGGGGEAGMLATARQDFVDSVGPGLLLAAYQDFVDRSEELSAALGALHGDLSAARLDEAQQAWRAARAAWNRSEPFLIGEPDDRSLGAQVDTTIVDEARIEEAIAGTAVLDQAFVSSVGSTRKGFFALEYLMFDPQGGDAAVLTALADGRRRDLLRALGRELAAVAREFRDAWAPSADNGLAEFTADPRKTVDDLVNRLVVLIELLADRRLGRPIGKTAGGVPQPPGSEAERSRNSLADIENDVAGIVALFDGPAGGTGLSALVRAHSVPVDDAVRTDLGRLVDAVDAIPDPLETADDAVIEEAFDRAKDFSQRVILDLVASMNVTLRFSPFDGD